MRGGTSPAAGRIPEILVRHLSGLEGADVEAWRETGTGVLYAVITQDARELWRELEANQAKRSTAADAAGQEPR